jgi:hypothetical protein
MTDALALPASSAPREHLADWLELRTLVVAERSTSFRDVVGQYKIGGVIDSKKEYEEGADVEFDEDEACEALAESVFAEIAEREKACGGPGASYPYEVSGDLVNGASSIEASIYTFLALLSKYGKDAGPTHGEGAKLFEEVSAKAAEVYLGGYHADVHSRVFGFPRRLLPAGFKSALDQLCEDLGEGVCHRSDRPLLEDQKDAKLDIVAWREFADRRPGKLIAFGQCATGQDWKDKIAELPNTDKWCSWWMADVPVVWPIRLFFVPHRIEYEAWPWTNIVGGILFDRCRIAHLTADIDPDIVRRCAEWSANVLKKKPWVNKKSGGKKGAAKKSTKRAAKKAAKTSTKKMPKKAAGKGRARK